MWAPARWVNHLFAVPMVSGDHQRATFCESRIDNPAYAGIHRFYGFDSGFENTGVTDHVTIGEVHDDQC